MNYLRFENEPLDVVDAAIVRALAGDARISTAELARRVGLSPPSVAERVRRLEDAGVIEGYAATVNPAALGRPLAAYIRIRPLPGQVKTVAEVVDGIDAVVACDRITGEDCFIAKVHVATMAELESVVDRIIPWGATNTSIIQSSPVKQRLVQIPGELAAPAS